MSTTDERLQTIIGRRIRAVRVLRGMSQEDLAIETRLPQVSISRYEHGHWRTIDPARLRLMAKILGVSVDSLMDDTLPLS